MQIMNLWGMFFHPANVSSLTFSLQVKSCSALCVVLIQTKLYLHGILFLAACRSLQHRHETQQAITIINITETHPTMRRSWRLIWQLRPANQGWHSHRTLEGPLLLSPSSTHFPFLLQRSHSVVVAESRLLDVQSACTCVNFGLSHHNLIFLMQSICFTC